LLAQISAQQHALDPVDCDILDSCVSNDLANTVANPFRPMFGGTGCLTSGRAIFNEPDPRYNQPMLPLVNLLRPFPQFDGDFEGLPVLEARGQLVVQLDADSLPEAHNPPRKL
jgi:hypothetical protein